MSPQDQLHTRGRGHSSPAARYFLPLVCAVLVIGCARETQDAPPNDRRTIVAEAGAGADPTLCAMLPDTAVELLSARPDENDLPLTRIELDPACPRATVLFTAGAHIQRTYRVPMKAGQLLVARVRGESGPVALNFDFPAAIKPDSSNFGYSVVDSIRVTEDRDVSIRVALIPRAKEAARASRVLLTVLARP
ncbi:hypothetical protein Strain138_000311 [Pseudogemmatithrix spongiicola]|uniref:Uncharacterized protein n=1 Tax=Pseudogemmatithrix spongiicola TaxID=3062599 RepID=A0AA49JXW4_9BACT|nr:hypothetical protein Strain138_000311 [Gemmatimonadaceae bacterium 'strain 138']WKW13986.1 hypothetical protein Strain318_000311 [Gemmatimonadaceae bacterium 'strain 318']